MTIEKNSEKKVLLFQINLQDYIIYNSYKLWLFELIFFSKSCLISIYNFSVIRNSSNL